MDRLSVWHYLSFLLPLGVAAVSLYRMVREKRISIVSATDSLRGFALTLAWALGAYVMAPNAQAALIVFMFGFSLIWLFTVLGTSPSPPESRRRSVKFGYIDAITIVAGIGGLIWMMVGRS